LIKQNPNQNQIFHYTRRITPKRVTRYQRKTMQSINVFNSSN